FVSSTSVLVLPLFLLCSVCCLARSVPPAHLFVYAPPAPARPPPRPRLFVRSSVRGK
ncbi:hypothetical protein L0F63_006328, partial [Massospora cicadina]